MNRQELDHGEIIRAVRLITTPNGVIEMRALEATLKGSSWPGTVSGYFDSPEALADAAKGIQSAKGIYIVPNEIDSSLLARANNRLRRVGKSEPTTADHDILRRRWLLIDIDPVRASGISSTEQERANAWERGELVVEHLRREGWPEPVIGDSGNGFHVLYPIDLPADDGGMVQRSLAALAKGFDDARAKIDTTVYNPARIWKLYGTMACKGDSTKDRPHRMAKLLQVPPELSLVTEALLLTLAGPAELPQRESGRHRPAEAPIFDLSSWIAVHVPNANGPKPWKSGGQMWELPVCPFHADHTDGSAYIGLQPSGAIVAGCHHISCQHWGWRDLRGRFELKKRTSSDTKADWPNPKDLPDPLPGVTPFNFDLLPAKLRPWIQDIAERMQCPPDFPAVSALVSVSSVIGRRVGIRPKRHDDWLVVPNLWGVCIGPPGVMKTPAIQEPLRLLVRLEAEARERHREEMQDYEALLLVEKAAKKNAEREIGKALKGGGDALGVAQSHIEKSPVKPIRRRHLVNDSTVEKLGEILNENTNGVLVFRDELIGLLRSLDRDGQEAARAFYLEAWNGTSGFTYDRIGRGTIDIEAAIVSLLGGIQPGRLMDYVAGAVRGGAADDGLIQRFQLAVWPDIAREWVNVDRWPDSSARRAAMEFVSELSELDAASIEAEMPQDGRDQIPFLRFDEDGQAVFNDWRAVLEGRLRSGDEHPAMESHLAKYRSLVPSIALILHLADFPGGPVRSECVRRAIRWAEYLESHARRMYAVAANRDAVGARVLAGKIRQGKLNSPFNLRDVYRPQWTGLTDREAAKEAVDLLCDLDWLRVMVIPTGGAPRTDYFVNPAILERPVMGTDTTDKREAA